MLSGARLQACVATDWTRLTGGVSVQAGAGEPIKDIVVAIARDRASSLSAGKRPLLQLFCRFSTEEH